MKERPLISIALCTHNGQSFLEQQLDSLIAQTYKNIEIIVVDDCSSDQTVEILETYAAKYPSIQLHKNKTRLGYNRNFEKALKFCKGELIAICDQDDIWKLDKLEIQQEAIKDNLLIYCDSILIDSNGHSMHCKITDKLNFLRGSSPEAFLFFNCVSGHTILLKRKLLRHVFPFPANFHYDQWLGFVASAKGSIDFINKPLVQYRIHGNNCTDILGSQNERINSKRSSIEKLRNESIWLGVCASIHCNSNELLDELFKKSIYRNNSIINPAYAFTIWKNREHIFKISKKSNLSKFFFTLRKMCGYKLKSLI